MATVPCASGMNIWTGSAAPISWRKAILTRSAMIDGFIFLAQQSIMPPDLVAYPFGNLAGGWGGGLHLQEIPMVFEIS